MSALELRMAGAERRGHPAAALVGQATALGIPWESILMGEIRAEKTLRIALGDADIDWPLSCAFYLLPNSLLESWRVRERLDRLSWQATVERSRDAAMELRAFAAHLSGKRVAGPPLDFLFAGHLCSGYERVFELQRVLRASRQCRGERADRIAAVAARTRCEKSEAEWAVDRSFAHDRMHVLEEAMRRTREEGFELPHARTELAAFRVLKRFLLRRGLLAKRQGRSSARAWLERR